MAKKFEGAIIRKIQDITFTSNGDEILSEDVSYQNVLTNDAVDAEMDSKGIVKDRSDWTLKRDPIMVLSEMGFELKGISTSSITIEGFQKSVIIQTDYYYQREL